MCACLACSLKFFRQNEKMKEKEKRETERVEWEEMERRIEQNGMEKA